MPKPEKRAKAEPAALPLQSQWAMETADPKMSDSNTTSSIHLLNYNQQVPVQTAIQAYGWQEVLPITRLPNSDPNDPLEFRFEAIENSYSDFFGGFLDYSISVWSLDALLQPTPLDVGELVCPINLCGLTYFKRVELWSQDLQVLGHYSDFDGIAYRRAHFYGSEYAKEYPMKSWGWYPDTPDRFNDVVLPPDARLNGGAFARMKLIEGSRKANFIVPLMFDVGGVVNLIPDKTDLLLRYYRHIPEYFLMTGAANNHRYVIKLDHAVFRLIRYQLGPSDLMHLNHLLGGPGILLAGTQQLVKRKTFLPGEQNLSFTCFREVLPSLIFVSLINADALNGNYHRNPQKVDLPNVRRMTVYKNDLPYAVQNGIQIPDQSNMELLYFYLLRTLKGATPTIVPTDLLNGYGIMAFDLSTGNTSNSAITSKVEAGTIRVEYDLNAALGEATVMVVEGLMMKNMRFVGEQARQLTIEDLNIATREH